MGRPRPTSGLLLKRWNLPNVGLVSLVRPARAALELLDENWSVLRSAQDISAGWRWVEVADDPDLFLLRRAADTAPLGLWRASKPTITLDRNRWYRLDNVEVHPGNRAAGLGRFLLLLIAARAAELDCSGVVLAAPSDRVAWYELAGAVDASSLDWDYPKVLKSLQFSGTTFLDMSKAAHELEDPTRR